MITTHLIPALDDLPAAAQLVLDAAGTDRVICFEGEIGAGKTTLIQAIGRSLGIREAVVSPTFSLVNEYSFGEDNIAYHLDLYRLESTEEALSIGVEEYCYSDHYCFVEWPDVVRGLLPERYLTVKLEIVEYNRRKMLLLKNVL